MRKPELAALSQIPSCSPATALLTSAFHRPRGELLHRACDHEPSAPQHLRRTDLNPTASVSRACPHRVTFHFTVVNLISVSRLGTHAAGSDDVVTHDRTRAN